MDTYSNQRRRHCPGLRLTTSLLQSPSGHHSLLVTCRGPCHHAASPCRRTYPTTRTYRDRDRRDVERQRRAASTITSRPVYAAVATKEPRPCSLTSVNRCPAGRGDRPTSIASPRFTLQRQISARTQASSYPRAVKRTLYSGWIDRAVGVYTPLGFGSIEQCSRIQLRYASSASR